MRRCAALRRPTCFKPFCTCKSHECGESASACCCTVFCNSAKVESLRALHQPTNVQRRSAWHTTPATLVARLAPVESLHSWSHCGWFVVHERRRLRPLTLRCVCNSACDGRIAAPVDVRMQWNTRGNIAASVSDSQRLFDAFVVQSGQATPARSGRTLECFGESWCGCLKLPVRFG